MIKFCHFCLILFLAQFASAQISIIGTATPAMDWTTDYVMTEQPAMSGIFRIDLYLNAGEVKFRKDASWTTNWGGTSWPAGTAVPSGVNIAVAQGGFYSISLDTTLLQYTFGTGSVGINNLDPKTNLDIAGSFNHRSVILHPDMYNSVVIPPNVSFVIISGPATSIIYGALPFTDADGYRLVIQNTTDFPASFLGTMINQGEIVEFIHSVNSGWTSLTPTSFSGPADGWSIYGNASTSPPVNFLGTTDNSDLSLRTNYLPRVTIKAGGNIGIATENPDGVVQVNSKATSTLPTINLVDSTLNNAGGPFIQFTNLAGSQKLKLKGSIGTASDGSDTYFDFFRNSNTLMSLRGDGNLGIGTLDPTVKLTVENSSQNMLALQNSNALNTNVNSTILFGGSNYRTGLISTIGTSTIAARMGFFTGYSVIGGISYLGERLSITNAGKVGIGITDPTERLDIDGNVCIRDNNFFELGKGLTKETNAGKIGYGLFGDPTSLSIVGAGTAPNNRKIKFWAEGGAYFDGGANFVGFVKMDNSLAVGTAVVPSGYKVAVDGKIIAEEMRIQNSTAWPDYVFEKEYPLMPLEELAKDIAKNKHLPGVPSAAEIEDKGIIVGELQSVLLKKIEELTLYIIELKKEVTELKSKLHE
ncbi:MAG: SusF/SusE family outer membrane protein [Saprospiraceae bacterium]|nr:SusF/SusE family outer membrane protein [Saprospiraceae bacterium]